MLQSFWSQIIRHDRATELNWTVTSQAPLFMKFSRKKYWCGLPFVSSCSGIEPVSPALQADSLLLSHQ